MMGLDATSFLLGITLGFVLRHYLPLAIAYIVVQLKRTGQHGQAQ